MIPPQPASSTTVIDIHGAGNVGQSVPDVKQVVYDAGFQTNDHESVWVSDGNLSLSALRGMVVRALLEI